MKTLKTIGAAFALTLLVSVVSAPAMENEQTGFIGTVQGYASTATKAVKGAVKAVDLKLFGTMQNMAAQAEDGEFGEGFTIRTKGIFPRVLSFKSPYARAAVVAATVAGLSTAVYATYNYLTAEEAEEASEEVTEEVQNTAPAPSEEVTVPTEEVSAPVETPVVEAPKAKVKGKRNPFAKRTVKRHAPAKAKAPKAKASVKNAKAKAPKAKASVNGKAKRNVSAKAKVARKANCQNGNCFVRRSK